MALKPLLLLPLDDRPCCWAWARRLATLAGGEVAFPPASLWSGLGQRLESGLNPQGEALREWLARGAAQGRWEGMVISLDQLLYGGLVNSRAPGPVEPILKLWAEWAGRPQPTPLYLWGTVMRLAPTQRNAREVELASRLMEANSHLEGPPPSGRELEEWLASWGLPLEYWAQYCARRQRKAQVDRAIIERWLTTWGPDPQRPRDYLAWGLDDSKSRGLNIEEARLLASLLAPAAPKAQVGPGTDEAPLLLLARHFSAPSTLKVVWSHPQASQIVTLYEGQPLGEVLKSQARWAGVRLREEIIGEVNRLPAPLEADARPYELWIYAPWREQGEALEQERAEVRELAEGSSAHFERWSLALERALGEGRSIVLADLAYANGGSRRLVEWLLREGRSQALIGYSAWNTAGNALGTALAWAALAQKGRRGPADPANRSLRSERLLDDYYYQSSVRSHLSRQVGGSFLSLDPERQRELALICAQKLEAWAQKYVLELPSGRPLSIYWPWGRLFEVGFND